MQVCSSIFGLGDSLQNAGERRHLLSAPATGAAPLGGEAVCDGRIQARPSVVKLFWKTAHLCDHVIKHIMMQPNLQGGVACIVICM